jgi:nucleoid-associated protein YgaU
MRSRTGVIAALFVLASGGGLALLFHKPPPPQAAIRTEEPIRHRADDGPRFLMEVRSSMPFDSSLLEDPIEPPLRAATDGRIGGLPLFESADDSVPRIARHYPPAADAALLPPPAETRHRISDGDTLALLARHYLGDAGRAEEIFAANRDLLTSPDLLPIGAMLRIPPRE